MNEKQRGRRQPKFTDGEYSKRSGQTKPRTPTGKVASWEPPTKGNAPADRKKEKTTE